MTSPRRNRARILTDSGLKKLRERMRSHEVEGNTGYKYSLERLGELTGLNSETVKNVLDSKGSDKGTLVRCFESFGLTLEESDYISAVQAAAAPSDPSFVGREGAIADLNALVSRNARVIVIQARGGVGKTTLARKYLQQEFGSFIEFPIAKETKDIASIEALIEEKLRQLEEEPGREFLVSLDRLKRKLQAERIGILIDNLEPALDSAGKFIEAHRRYVELLRVLSDLTVKSITLITSRERLRESDITVQHYPLRSLDVKAWEQFFQSRGINAETPALVALHNAYGGNAKAMDIISGAVLEDFSSDVEAYWQANQNDLFIERDLEDLVKKQFDRLQQLDPDAYKLLCRMGCYRYQDVPTVPIEGLFYLLWDVEENRQRRVIKSLQDRSLIDFQEEFWLHPAIRVEAITRLKNCKDWEVTNKTAAEFFTQNIQTINTLKDAIEVFEAYYHYIKIKDYKSAGNVVLGRRQNIWGQKLPLCTLFYRLGLIKQVIEAISYLLENLNHKETDLYDMSRLYSNIGNAYWIKGEIRKAIKLQEKSREILNQDVTDVQSRKRHSLLSEGIYRIDLWELEEASEFFQETISLAKQEGSREFIVKTSACLAFVMANMGYGEEAQVLIQEISDDIISYHHLSVDKFIYYGHFLSLANQCVGNFSCSLKIYNQILSCENLNYYAQAKARAIEGTSRIYRKWKEYENALSKHLESIFLFKEIDAKCDLAEAHYQTALTYQEIGEVKNSLTNFQEAIRLFTEMEAPKQVERVRQSMQKLEV